MPYGEVGAALGVHPNSLRYASLTGTVLIRWDGARQRVIWTIPRPDIGAEQACRELARRYLHAFGPATVASFVRWGGLDRAAAIHAFYSLGPSLLAVRTPLGEAQILVADEPAFRAPAAPAATARLLPSGDPYFLLWGADRELLVPDAARRHLLWTPRVWPGAVLVDGQVIGTWRRDKRVVAVTPWRLLSSQERQAVEAEAASLPLPDIDAPVVVHWDESEAV
jgi:hypothetical protein